MASQPYLIDGDFSRAKTQGPPRSEYPFRKNGDRITEVFEQDYWQTKETFTLGEFSVEHPHRLGFYLIAEATPIPFHPLMLQFTRTFSRVPIPQSVPGSIWVTKPAIPGTFPQILGDSLVIQPDSTQAVYKFYTRKLVTSDSGAPNGSSPTGGTYTVTVAGSTTSGIAYNANAATVKTAINGLASVAARGTVNVTGSYTAGFLVTFDDYATGTINVANLLPGGFAGVGVTPYNYGTGQQFAVGSSAGSILITGGSITASLFGDTTPNIAYNDTTANFQSAIQALPNVGVSGTVVTQPGAGGWGNKPLASSTRGLQFFVSLTRPTSSTSGASLTPAGSTASLTPNLSRAVPGDFNLTFTGVAANTRIIFSAAHGITEADAIYAKFGGTYLTLAPGLFTVPSVDTIIFNSTSGAVFSTGSTITEVGKYASTYTAGSVLSRCKRVSTFYLPGVTPGISTSDDIPLPALQADPVSLVAAILAGTPSINYEVGELAQWRDSPILTRTITTISAAGL